MTRRTLIIAGLLLAIVAAVAAVNAQRQRLTPQERTDRLVQELSLTADQKTKVLDIMTKNDEKMQELFEDRNGDRAAMRESMKKVREETEASMKKVLTEDQYALWLKHRQQRPGRGGMR